MRKQNNQTEKNMAAKNNLAEAVVIERTFNAPVARVWKALTDANENANLVF
jgi:uncharacterized protein YndB with AHSA1/START domain